MKMYSHIESVEEYLNNLFTLKEATLNNGKLEMSSSILNILSSGKFRKTTFDIESKKDAQIKISQSISSDKPIFITIPFGGYKNWNLPSYPYPDWAEIFCLSYLLRYVNPISQIYKFGVTIQFTYSSNIMDFVSNIPLEDQSIYINSFLRVLEFVNSIIPENIRFRLIDISEEYIEGELKKEYLLNYNENLKDWKTKYPKIIRDKKVASAMHNFQIKGNVDYTNKTGDQMDEIFLDSAKRCDALDCLKKRRLFNKNSESIQLVFVRGPIKSIHIGSCDIASKHFWVSLGCLEERKNRFLTDMVTFKQFNENLNKKEFVKLNINTIFNDLIPTLSTIRVFANK